VAKLTSHFSKLLLFEGKTIIVLDSLFPIYSRVGVEAVVRILAKQ